MKFRVNPPRRLFWSLYFSVDVAERKNMKKLIRVYIDTSVIGGCFDDEFAEWSGRLFRDFQAGNLKPVISEIVTAEIEPAPAEVLQKYSELLSYDPEFAEISREVSELADAYIRKGILSENYFDDAMHIALATVSEADVLVSWNFRHIVHLERIRLFNSVNLEYGYKPIQIYSPREVATYEDTNGQDGS